MIQFIYFYGLFKGANSNEDYMAPINDSEVDGFERK
jgi:hypothetical protein